MGQKGPGLSGSRFYVLGRGVRGVYYPASRVQTLVLWGVEEVSGTSAEGRGWKGFLPHGVWGLRVSRGAGGPGVGPFRPPRGTRRSRPREGAGKEPTPPLTALPPGEMDCAAAESRPVSERSPATRGPGTSPGTSRSCLHRFHREGRGPESPWGPSPPRHP